MKNKKVLIPAILTAALAAGGLVGGSLAFFQVEQTHEITISTALVNVTSVIDATSLKTYSLGIEQPAGHFENEGSTATLNGETGKLELVNVAPGDEARFDIKLTNTSTIGVRYEVTTILKVGNAEVADADNPFVITGAAEGTLAVAETEKTINVGVLFPMGIEDESLMGQSYTLLVRVVAMQSNAPKAVATQAELVEAIHDGLPVELEQDIQLSSVMELSQIVEDGAEVTIVGNGKTITAPAASSATRAINIDGVEDVTLNLVDVDIDASDKERGVSVYDAPGTEINVVDSTVSASMYSINIASNSPGSVVNVKDSNMVSGWCGVQTWSANSTINIENSTIAGINDKGYNADGWNNFSTIVINEPATNSTINIKNSKIIAQVENQGTAEEPKYNKQTFLSFRSTYTTVNFEGENTLSFIGPDSQFTNNDELAFVNAGSTFTSQEAIETLQGSFLSDDLIVDIIDTAQGVDFKLHY